MQPAKNNACTNPTLNLSPQTNPHSATVELSNPPTHSHEPRRRPQTLAADVSQPDRAAPVRHVHRGSRSAKIMTIVWNASRAQARLTRTKCFSCHQPNSPQYFRSMSSMQSFSRSEERRGGRRSAKSEEKVVAVAISDNLGWEWGWERERERPFASFGLIYRVDSDVPVTVPMGLYLYSVYFVFSGFWVTPGFHFLHAFLVFVFGILFGPYLVWSLGKHSEFVSNFTSRIFIYFSVLQYL